MLKSGHIIFLCPSFLFINQAPFFLLVFLLRYPPGPFDLLFTKSVVVEVI